jgi:hypothetical protein
MSLFGPIYVTTNELIKISWAQKCRKRVLYEVGFQVLAAVSTKMAVFWVVAPCTRLPDYTTLQPRRQPS